MTLPPRSRLGPYEVVALLGAGGMGEVYRARDTRLARDVAIKVLPDELSASSDRLKRFEREARAASSLNHPNIVTIYEVERTDSTFFIVMELVEGKTLREVLADGPLSVKKLLGLAPQIADGLARAHTAGVVHRDLKPENVMVTKEGLVKILDFGLATLVQPEKAGGQNAESPTLSAGTRPGIVIGTAGYMSPEQASGQPVDFRSDQFALGSLLYEMATGQPAFQRASAAQTLAAIIQEEPEPIAVANPRVLAPLRWIVERCLTKEPKDRYDSTRDLARDLARLRDGLSETTLSSGAAAAAPSGRGIRSRLLIGFSALAGLLVVLASLRFALRASVQPPRFRPITFRRGLIPGARFSPDGQSVVYGAGWEGKPIELYTARPPSPDARALGLPSASVLAISSAGEMAISMGCNFRLDWHSCFGTLAQASLSGGAPRELLEQVHQADWSPDGKDLAVVREEQGGGHRLEFPVGHVLHKGRFWIGQPRVSPHSDEIAFFESTFEGGSEGSLSVVNVQGGQVKRLSSGWQTCSGLSWSPAGDEVWFTGTREKQPDAGALHAVSMSGRLRTVWRGAGALRLHDVAKDGRVLMTLDSIRAGLNGLFPGDAVEHDYSWFGFSVARELTPDGRLLLFADGGVSQTGAYLRKTDGSPAVSLGDTDAVALSPDGKWVVSLVPAAGGLPHLALLPIGPGERRVLPNSSLEDYQFVFWFSDGKRFSFEGREKGRRRRCYEQVIDGGEAKPLTAEGTGYCRPAPDGRLLVASHDQGHLSVFPVGGGEGRPVAPAQAGEIPVQWTSDSAGLYLRKREVPGHVERLDLASGKRALWKDLNPSDPAGVLGVGDVTLTPDGRFYAYTYRRMLSELYVVEGLR